MGAGRLAAPAVNVRVDVMLATRGAFGTGNSWSDLASGRRARNSGTHGPPTTRHWADRGPNMMMPMPTRLTTTPIQSVVVGRMPSTAQSQRMAIPM